VELIQWGVPLIEWLQSQAWLEDPARLFSALGDVRIMILWIPAVAWAVDWRLGRRLLLAMTAWGAVNTLVKVVASQPRPYWVEASVAPLASESSFGFASGHAAFAMVVWGALALAVPKRWVRVLAAVMIVGIGASRIVLGVHWPADVIGGWLLGAGVLALVVWADGGIRPGTRTSPLTSLGPIGGMVATGLLGVLPLAVATVAASRVGPVDPDWLALGARGAEAIDPTRLVGAGLLAGGLLGAVAGSVISTARGQVPPIELPIVHRVLRVANGLLVLVFVTWSLGGMVDRASITSVPLAWLLGAAVGWWVLDGSQRLFDRMGLSAVVPTATAVRAP